MVFRKVLNPTPLKFQTDLLETEFNAFKLLFNHVEIKILQEGNTCKNCNMPYSFVRDVENMVCSYCGYCEDLEPVATESDWIERKGNAREIQYYKKIDYLYKKLRYMEARQYIRIPKDIMARMRHFSSLFKTPISVFEGLRWLKGMDGYYKKYRKHIHFIVYKLTGERITFPMPLKRDIVILYSRFVEFYRDYKVNKVKIPPFNFLMRSFIDIISQVRGKKHYLVYKLYFKQPIYLKGHNRNIQVFETFKQRLIKEYVSAITPKTRYGRVVSCVYGPNEQLG